MSKPTVHDIAREAGVSLATVDRVLNERPGVRVKTVARVKEAVRQLGYVRDLTAANLARRREYSFVFVLPDGSGQFLSGLQAAIAETAAAAANDRTNVKTLLIPSRDHTALVRILDDLNPAEINGLAIMANETPYVRDTIARMKEAGVAVVTMVADQPNSERDWYVGIDNVAAGRTAGTLLGRFLGAKQGKIIVVATSMQARDMVERRMGFDQVLSENFPNLHALPSIEGHDDPDLTETLTRHCLKNNPDAVGVYGVGASVQGIAQALQAHQGSERLVCIDHELTPNSRDFLKSGLLDAVITQDTGHLARSAMRVLRGKCDGRDVITSQERIRIDIVIRENLL